MFRIFLAIAAIAAIFTYSPHRQGLGLADSVAAASKSLPAQLADAVVDTHLGPALAGAMLRRTLVENGEAAAQLASRLGADLPAEPARPGAQPQR